MILNKKISVLYINAMGPSEKTPNGGIFITQRIRALREVRQIDVIPVSLFLNYSRITKFLLHLRAGAADLGNAVARQMDVTYDVFETRYSPLELFLAGSVTSKAYYFKSKKILTKMIRSYPDVQMLHMHWLWPCGMALPVVSKKYSLPYVITCHGSEINVAMRKELFRKEIIRILESAYCVEFVSYALLETAVELGYSGKNAKVINNGIDTSYFHGKRVDHDIKTVGFVGNLIAIKGADRLPAIFKMIDEMMQGNVKFVIAGDGTLRKTLEEEMAGLPVTFHGFVSPGRLADLYAEMDVLLLPSRNEGYGCVLKEAQACGVIPVAADVGGIAEAVGEYGTTISVSGNDEELISHLAESVVDYLSGRKTVDASDMIQDAMDCSWQNQQKKSAAVYLDAVRKSTESFG